MRSIRWFFVMLVFSCAVWGCEDEPGEGCDPLNSICEGDVRALPDQTTGGDTGPDTAVTTAPDATEDGTATGEDGADFEVDEDCGLGGIRGRVCAPRNDEWIGGARVVIQGMDCRTGEAFEMETLSDAEGNFEFVDVPSGSHLAILQKGSFEARYEIAVEANRTIDVTGGLSKTCLIDDGVRIAVVRGLYDSIEGIVSDLGLKRDFFSDFGAPSPGEQLLLDPDTLATYDILMLNCGDQWDTFAEKDAIIENIRNFVLSGGNVYASDWFYPWIEAAFPGSVDFVGDDAVATSARQGAMGDVTGFVLDSRLERTIGQQELTIHYPLPGWTVIEAVDTETVSLVAGTVSLRAEAGGGTVADSPLLVRFHPTSSSGLVYFTTFHNEEQLDAEIERVLKHVIFSL